MDQSHLAAYLGWTVVLILGSGALVLLCRVILEGTPKTQRTGADKTLVRSWLAVALTGGLLLFAAGSFFIDDPTVRSLLMGGVVASAGTAVAFYFASKASEQTQQNLLSAAFGNLVLLKVPDVRGRTVADARRIIEALPLKFVTNSAAAGDQGTVTDTIPPADGVARPGDTVMAMVSG
jgi:hypothetical protein